ncbi:uncharacterized protein LOC133869045 [Alnus glutinosa]|uniref:uncharacterized protein LOC133869045 n=1 Tax=Alnus glutinosa TaxID=3517 RepID=UPI002D786BFB|nr:uncharacterized protein LOC133869045 [Alnus glutinosa]
MGSPYLSVEINKPKSEIATNLKKPRSGNFSIEEDVLLVESWINTSVDPVNGNDQSKKKYWWRIWEKYHEHKTFNTSRNEASLLNRWGVIHKNVNKFCGCLAQVESAHQSGITQQDKELYRSLVGVPFAYEHCWNLLKNCPKWSTNNDKTRKRLFGNASSPFTESPINLGEDNVSTSNFVDLERPEGMKAAKERLNKKERNDNNDDIVVGYFKRKGGSSSRRGGSVPGRMFIDRNSLQGHLRLFLDYFADSPVYPPKIFRRRFWMHRHLFCRILSKVKEYDPYFVQRRNCAGTIDLSSLQKVTDAFRMLAYGVPADYVDEYVRIGETTIESLQRSPNSNDVARLLEVGETRGFPGMLGSIDCMHWTWRNCPVAWTGSHNDINVLERSFVFSHITEGRAPPANYTINGHNYTMGYYLGDSIYPQWPTIVKTISCPQGKKAKLFAAAQESARKHLLGAFSGGTLLGDVREELVSG